uniref:Tyrosine-protein kinase ephrin type A/B receptor-like domain-containing protein n=1 Tax=Chromera velia CCMP2878 TaxID=1169474 RepID=A0A0G4GAU8_9ALVE|eukprot:Cvel_21059.t1-p1 / transcript=Cvel_21059.t1 / gene=Cvel_21059 / organism=Chromera_velia_CCMP2878 / gene_product=Signal peptide, CUB and EGF-like domain-containing, putative / transcript_product=Signal peptide, CUB and EGF-like domain-containing, putative / location=Cvel_scaffold1945:17747-28745(-) / protein_length=970 / sequence_SO=supercontig / SO=protein_coding / is_pseudo=false
MWKTCFLFHLFLAFIAREADAVCYLIGDDCAACWKTDLSSNGVSLTECPSTMQLEWIDEPVPSLKDSETDAVAYRFTVDTGEFPTFQVDGFDIPHANIHSCPSSSRSWSVASTDTQELKGALAVIDGTRKSATFTSDVALPAGSYMFIAHIRYFTDANTKYDVAIGKPVDVLSSSACGPGSFHEGGVSGGGCVQCPAGTYSNQTDAYSCTACEEGFFSSSAGSSGCQACPEGQYRGATDDASACLRCAKGSYQDKAAQSSCIECAPSKTTLGLGSIVMSDCSCEVGFFLDRQADVCRSCEDKPHLKCPGGDGLPLTEAGYWASPVKDLEKFSEPRSFRCMNRRACTGGTFGPPGSSSNRTSTSSTDTEGQHEDGTEKEWENSDAQCFGARTGFMCESCPVGMYKYLLVLRKVDVDLPDELTRLWDILSVVSFDIAALRQECAFPTNRSTTVFGVIVAVPFFVALSLFVLYGLSFPLHRWYPRVKPWKVNKVINTIGFCIQLIHVVVAVQALQPYDCVEHPSGDSTLRSFPEIFCGSPTQRSLSAIGIVACVIYLILLPGWFAAMCIWAKHWSKQDKNFVQRYKFLFSRFSPLVPSWGLVLLFKNLFFAAIPVLFPNSAVMSLLLLSGLNLICIVLQIIVWPWIDGCTNIVDAILGAGLQMLIVICCFYADVRSESPYLVPMALTSFAIICVALGGLSGLQVYNFVYATKVQERLRAQAEALAERLLQACAEIVLVFGRPPARAILLTEKILNLASVDVKTVKEYIHIATSLLLETSWISRATNASSKGGHKPARVDNMSKSGRYVFGLFDWSDSLRRGSQRRLSWLGGEGGRSETRATAAQRDGEKSLSRGQSMGNKWERSVTFVDQTAAGHAAPSVAESVDDFSEALEDMREAEETLPPIPKGVLLEDSQTGVDTETVQGARSGQKDREKRRVPTDVVQRSAESDFGELSRGTKNDSGSRFFIEDAEEW